MPELPEVELISRSLHSMVSGRIITRAVLIRQRLAPDITPTRFDASLRSATINEVTRRGKHILFDIGNGRTLIVHLRMSGRFSILPAETVEPKFTHAVFHFADGDKLVFDDQRHFGLMKVVRSSELYEAKELKKLAPEPFSPEFSVGYLHDKLSSSTRNIKEFLIDQTRVCGLGNIYACEALFAARIDPRKAANTISAIKVRRLHESILAVLSEAIEHNSRREADPENIEGSYFSGGGSGGWYVYDREGEPCSICGTNVLRIRQGSRSTYYCRRCQRK